MKVRKLYLLVAVVILLTMVPALGCGGTTPASKSPTPTAAPAPTTVAPKPTTAAPAPTTAAPAAKVVTWDVALYSPKGNYNVASITEWANDMEKLSNGKWKLNLHYGGSLSATNLMLDGLKAGLFQAAQDGALYYPAKMPLHTVAELPFFWPPSLEATARITQEAKNHPVLVKWMAEKWDALQLFQVVVPSWDIIGNKPIKTVADFKGTRIRASGDLGKLLAGFGAVPAMFNTPDAYQLLERGTVDSWPTNIAAMGDYGMHEVTKYLTINTALSAGFANFSVKKTAWEALPDDLKKLAIWWAEEKSIDARVGSINKTNMKWMPIFYSKLQVTEFPAAERDKLVAAAQPIYDQWVEARNKEGLPGKEILDYFFAVRKKYTEPAAPAK